MPGSSALIGYTGFVGGNLLKQRPFEFLYNSKNIEDIRGKNLDLVISAGTPSIKWLANKEPEKDWATIERLIKNLERVEAKKFILISTIDVYNSPVGVNEDSFINCDCLPPYGQHRRQLEEFIANQFDALVVRLCGIYGPGLKKNPLFDLINRTFDYIHSESELQFYCLDHLWNDIEKALANNLKIVNLVAEPLTLREVAKETLGLDISDKKNGTPQHYDVRTKFSHLWGKNRPYLYTKEEVLSSIKKFSSASFLKNTAKN